jgi:hypothetical protein
MRGIWGKNDSVDYTQAVVAAIQERHAFPRTFRQRGQTGEAETTFWGALTAQAASGNASRAIARSSRMSR